MSSTERYAGNGQAAAPGQLLPQAISVLITKDGEPLKNRGVWFRTVGGYPGADGALQGLRPFGLPGPEGDPQPGPDNGWICKTGVDGVALCAWTLGNSTIQRVEAQRLNRDGVPRDSSVIFNATLQAASQVAFSPGDCAPLAGVSTVHEALRRLCELLPEAAREAELEAVPLAES